MTRDEAYALVREWVHNPNLRKHLLAVEACMRAYARRFGADEEEWGTVGLLHDLDYERHPHLGPGGHPFVGVEELRRRGVPEHWCRAILSHADYSGVPRETLMERALFACDEITGFVVAVALVKGRSLRNVDVDSVKRKMRDKAFARAVRREDLLRGAEELGVSFEEHVAAVLEAMRGIGEVLELA
ncbi:MAG: HDIG domain-containing protein [Armatimonadota bacterium]|nr:HDIG domain-containing protein [Armatimonadota bacterium]MDW8155643.1 HDIG domain-containing protein [Armatimonadota bacterium]